MGNGLFTQAPPSHPSITWPAPAASPWSCRECQAGLATESLATRAVGGTVVLQCPHCSGPVKYVLPPSVRATFYEELASVVLYPSRGYPADFVLCMTTMLLLTGLAVRASLFALPLLVPVLGYVAAWLMRLINRTAEGDDDVPNWSSATVGLLRYFFMFLACAIYCMLPVLVYAVGVKYLGLPFRLIIFPFLLSILVLPMCMLRVAVMETVEALHPVAVFKSIAM